jgi:NUMOD3 motif
MNYALAYQRLIAHAQQRVCINGYVERHHILPKALGGSEDSSNLVALTAREHFIAHMLLARMYGGSMWYAVTIMKKDGRGSSRSFAIARKKLSEQMMGNKNTFGMKMSDDTKMKMSQTRKGKAGRPQSDETKKLLSVFNTGKVVSEETRKKLSAFQKGKAKPDGFGAKVAASLKGRPRSEETKAKLVAHYAALREARNAINTAFYSSLPNTKEI